MSRPKIRHPGRGTIAALRHVCPHCGAGLGALCTTPSGGAREHVHSKRMDLARASAIRARHGEGIGT